MGGRVLKVKMFGHKITLWSSPDFKFQRFLIIKLCYIVPEYYILFYLTELTVVIYSTKFKS